MYILVQKYDYIKEKYIPENLKNKKEQNKTIQIDNKKYAFFKLDLDNLKNFI
tara:strand:+ start:456 stop:611 length:156 start_codon:yes stop_codon:yes gene_type:complete